MSKKTSLTEMDLILTVKNLSRKRPAFHSEADFQLALARQIEEEYECQVRLEYPVYIKCLPFEADNGYKKKPKKDANLKSNYLRINGVLKIRRYLDILLLVDKKKYPIELKYKTSYLEMEDMAIGDRYNLADMGAQNLGSYDFWKDVYRIENMTDSIEGFERGFTVWLTNDVAYLGRNNSKSQYFDFSVAIAKDATGNLCWRKKDKSGQYYRTISDSDKKDRRDMLPLKGKYQVKWNMYAPENNSNVTLDGVKELCGSSINDNFFFAVNEIKVPCAEK